MPDGYKECKNGIKVHPEKFCDGVDDCFDNTDENNCSMKCNMGAEKLCDDRSMCIMVDWICDGYVDCTDGSDEKNCGNYTFLFTILQPLLCSFC